MKIHNFPQNSLEWDNIRKGKITASMFKEFITPQKLEIVKSSGSKKAIAQIIASSICSENSDDFETFAMARGTENEPRARALYSETQLVKVDEIGFIEDDSGLVGCSTDGLVDENGFIEIKRQNQKEHFYCKLFGFDEWLKKYKPQILLPMIINPKFQWCDCISYNEDFKNDNDRLIIHRYNRDEEEIEKATFVLNHWVGYLRDFNKI